MRPNNILPATHSGGYYRRAAAAVAGHSDRQQCGVPTLPPRQCDAPNCPALVQRGERFCEAHADRKPDRRKWSEDRPPPEQRGYGPTWRRLRKLILHRDPVCKVCGVAPSTAVDHVRPLAEAGDNAMENLQGICGPCHDRKSAAEAVRARRLRS